MVDFNRPHTKTQKLFINNVEVTATADELNKAAAIASNTAEYTVSGAIPAAVQNIELNHISVDVDMTIADFADHQGLVTIKDTSASGTQDHTVTLTSGTFNGSDQTVTFDAGGEGVVIFVDSAGNGIVVANVGTVIFSA